MDVTVVLTGIPKCDPELTLHDLAFHLEKIFDTDEIGTYKLRNLPDSKQKRQVALDFTSGYDAMYAQNLLDGKTYSIKGEVNLLRARVTRDPKLMPDVPLSRRLLDEPSSSTAPDETQLMPITTENLIKANKRIEAKMNLLEIKKTAILTEEEQLLLEREKLKKELEKLNCESPPRKRSRSVSTDSSEPRSKSKKHRHRSHKAKETKSSRERHSRDLRASSRELRGTSYERRERRKKYRSPGSSDRSVLYKREVDRYDQSRYDRSESEERFDFPRVSYQTTGIISVRRSPSKRDSRFSSERTKMHRAIEYRPRRSSYGFEKGVSSRKSESLERNERHTDKIPSIKCENIKTELEIEMEEINAKRADSMKAKQEQAIKDILFELVKHFNELCVQHNISDADQSKLQTKITQIVCKRIVNLRITSAMTVTNLVMNYRCKYSKIEDKELVTEMFSNILPTPSETTESDVTSGISETVLAAVDSVLEDFELPVLTEDVKPKLEPESEEEITNITININPITTDNNKKQYKTQDDGYYVNVTINENKRKKYYITIKKLLRDMKTYMKKYQLYVEYELFVYIMRGVLEKQIDEMLEGKKYMSAKMVYDLYREIHPQADDETFVVQTVYDIWEGVYNDPVGEEETKETSEKDLNKSKVGKVKVKTEPLQATDVKVEVIKDAGNTTELPGKVHIKKEIKMEPMISDDDDDDDDATIVETSHVNVINKVSIKIENEKPPPVKKEIDTSSVIINEIETNTEVIDLSDTDETPNIKTEVTETKANEIGTKRSMKPSTNDVIDLSAVDDVPATPVSNEGKIDSHAGDVTAHNVAMDNKTSEIEVSKTKSNKKQLKDKESKNKVDSAESGEPVYVSDTDKEQTIEVIVVEDADTGVITNESTSASSNNFKNQVSTISEDTDIEKKDTEENASIDFADDSSVDTVILETDIDYGNTNCKADAIENTNVINENVANINASSSKDISLKVNPSIDTVMSILKREAENREGNNHGGIVTEELNKCCDERNDFSGESEESLENIKQYVSMITGCESDTNK